ncbi:MAG: HD domain-containing protein [Deltaproteobacteria bacterium]|nr:HD domain-containing protein [Deltaproteobacteria bacterium]
MKPSVKTITVKMLLTVILLAALSMTIIIGFSFRTLSHKIVKNQAIAISELVKAGITSHMKAGIMDKRDYFLSEIRSLKKIEGMKVVRSQYVINQFGPGFKGESDRDELINLALTSKEAQFVVEEFVFYPSIRSVIPFIASKEGALSCLDCHKVKEGTVLGAVDISLDLSEYRNDAMWIIGAILGLSVMFVVMIIINTFKTVQQHVKDPLEHLIEKAREAYNRHKPVEEELFESLEFENVAKEINLFNDDIVKSHILLEEKNKELSQLNDEIEETLKETIFTMGIIEEQKSKETKNHTRRVSEYCKLLAKKYGLSHEEVEIVGSAAPLHDIGKIGISDYILLKTGPLTLEEQEIMKSHTLMGYSMLIHSTRSILKAAAIISHQHHEKWDGSGYPQGLKGENIHIYGRIAALADVFDALSMKRPYKEPWTTEKILKHIEDSSGSHFDPVLVAILFNNLDEFKEIGKKYNINFEEPRHLLHKLNKKTGELIYEI